ncbi:hypothetical protein GCM10022393_10770 [Aquimarina addita]|uniref:Uncharacterized protein n=1 Tax=Aquimarina addita TaxID=870485 RepID=A0ABP7XD95_9FLAO
MNLHGVYWTSLYQNNFFDIYGSMDISLGNIFTYVKPAVNFRLGKFNSVSSSVVYPNAILINKSNKDFF